MIETTACRWLKKRTIWGVITIGLTLCIGLGFFVFVSQTFAASSTPVVAPVAVPTATTGTGDSFLDSLLKCNINVGCYLLGLLGGLAGVTIWIIGQLTLVLIFLLLTVAKYNSFINSTAVTEGWKIARDVSNMGFVLVLLSIAIGTILQRDEYHYQKRLPVLIGAAILINFSKTICGLIIDASQVVMLTFVGAFADASGGGNLAAMLGFQNWLRVITETKMTGSMTLTILASYMLAITFAVIACVVVGVFLAQLVIRIIALWFLIVLSPFIALSYALGSQGSKYVSSWWGEFTNYILLGPAMAFFLWLSLTVVAKSNEGISKASELQLNTELGLDFSSASAGAASKFVSGAGATAIGGLSGVASYLLGIFLLLGSLVAAQQLSKHGSKMAGAALSKMQDWATGKSGFLPQRYIVGRAQDTLGTAATTFFKNIDPSRNWKARGERMGGQATATFDRTLGQLPVLGGNRLERAGARARAHEILEGIHQKDKDTFKKGNKYAVNGKGENEEAYRKAKTDSERAAIVETMLEKNQLDDNNTFHKEMVKEVATSMKSLPEIHKKFLDSLNAKMPNTAFNLKYGDPSDPKFMAQVSADINAGVLKNFTKHMADQMNLAAQRKNGRATADGAFMEDYARGNSPEQIKEFCELLKGPAKGAILKDANISTLNDDEKQLAFGKATNRWDQAYDPANQNHTDAFQAALVSDPELKKQYANDASAGSYRPDLLQAYYQADGEFTDDQLAAIQKDSKKRTAFKAASDATTIALKTQSATDAAAAVGAAPGSPAALTAETSRRRAQASQISHLKVTRDNRLPGAVGGAAQVFNLLAPGERADADAARNTGSLQAKDWANTPLPPVGDPGRDALLQHLAGYDNTSLAGLATTDRGLAVQVKNYMTASGAYAPALAQMALDPILAGL